MNEQVSELIKELANNSGSSIAFMHAQATLTLAEAVKAGKVQTILIPHDLKMIGSLK